MSRMQQRTLGCRVIAVVSGLAIVAAGMLVSGPASAAVPSTASAPRDFVYQTQVRGVHKTDKGVFNGDWKHCLFVPKEKYVQMANCAQGATVTTTYSATFGFKVDDISAAVGFSISVSKFESSSISVKINPGGTGYYDAGFHYRRYTIGMESRTCRVAPAPECPAWSGPSTITVQQRLAPTFMYFGTGAATS